MQYDSSLLHHCWLVILRLLTSLRPVILPAGATAVATLAGEQLQLAPTLPPMFGTA
jgi:hypothetical protein